MKFRFQVVCSKYHKGRLKVVYDPTSTAVNAEYNTAYTTIIDIADTTDFTITVGWGQATSYRESLPFAAVTEDKISSLTPLTYDSVNDYYGNGTLAVYVVNELTVPDTTINNDISINVFVSMGDDFEVAEPDARRLQRVRLTNKDNLIQPQSFDVFPPIPDRPDIPRPFDEVLPQANETPNQGDEQERMDSKPHHAPNINIMSALTTLSDQTNHIHFGENIRSFRQLLKRYSIHELPGINGTTDTTYFHNFNRHSLPFEPGYTAYPSSLSTTVNGINEDEYVYGFMTLPRYMSCAYGGWKGGMRYCWDFTKMGQREAFSIASVLNDDSKKVPINQQSTLDDTTDPFGKAAQIGVLSEYQGFNGMTMQSKYINPTLNFEVPYYSEYRFTPAKQRVHYLEEMFGMPRYNVAHYGTKGDSSDTLISYVAAAEDFTCFMFLGAPIFYYEEQPPFT